MSLSARFAAAALAVAMVASILLDVVATSLLRGAVGTGAAVPLGQRLLLAAVLLAGIACVAGFGMTAFRRVEHAARDLAQAADRALSDGAEIPAPEPDDPLGSLAESVELMRRGLVDRMEAAASSRRLLSSVVSGLREGILVVGPQRRILHANEALKRILDIPSALPDDSRLIDAVWDHGILQAFDESLGARATVSRRLHLSRGRVFECTVTPFMDAAGDHAGAIGLFFDVTRIESLEQVRKAFVADISHEIRTPLTSIQAALETLSAGAFDDPGDRRRFLDMMVRNTARMEAILGDLGDLSMIETGAVSYAFAEVPVEAALHGAVAALAPRAEAKSVSVRIDSDSSLRVRADRRRFDQVLLNLLDNAIKFSPAGGAVIVRAARAGARARITVEDEGPGIPPQALERVFNRFFRVDRARAKEIEGTGLGLAIVKHLVRGHGGTVIAENRPEGGARFVVDLPVAGPPDA